MRETGLLPHVNPGVMSEADIAALRRVSVSQGIMLENVSPRLCERGGPHHGSPDKEPAARLATIEAAGRLGVPFTTGILIGIGETRDERIDSLAGDRDAASPLRPHPGGHRPEFPRQGADRHGARARAGLWTRCCGPSRWRGSCFGPEMNIQAPPNLNPGMTSIA